MRVAIGADERTVVADKAIELLKAKGFEIIKVGALRSKEEQWRWADIGREVGQLVSAKEVGLGIVFCWSGTGVSMAANKVPGVRAALCWDSETAKLARKWNDANVLALSLRYVSEAVLEEIIEAWLSQEFDEEDLSEVAKL